MLSSYTAMGTYVLVLTLASLLVIVLLWQRHRSAKDLPIWAASGIVGILLGAGLVAAIGQLQGYEFTRMVDLPDEIAATIPPEGTGPPPGITPEMAFGGGGGGFGGGGFGGQGPSAKRQLTTLVRKLDLLTGDIQLNLSAEQSSAVVAALADIEKSESMSDEEAQSKYDALLAILDEQQQAKQEAVGLPFGRGGGARGGGARGGGGGGRGGGGGGGQDPDANPFDDERAGAALASLRERFASQAAQEEK